MFVFSVFNTLCQLKINAIFFEKLPLKIHQTRHFSNQFLKFSLTNFLSNLFLASDFSHLLFYFRLFSKIYFNFIFNCFSETSKNICYVLKCNFYVKFSAVLLKPIIKTVHICWILMSWFINSDKIIQLPHINTTIFNI